MPQANYLGLQYFSFTALGPPIGKAVWTKNLGKTVWEEFVDSAGTQLQFTALQVYMMSILIAGAKALFQWRFCRILYTYIIEVVIMANLNPIFTYAVIFKLLSAFP